MYNTRSRARQQPAPRRRQDVSGYVLYTLLSAIYQKLSRLERPVPVTCALLGINIAAHVLPEAFLPFGVNLVEIGGICLQPSRIVKLMMPPTPSSYGGGGRRSGSSSFFPGLASLLSSLGDVAQGSQGFMTPSSASARWQEAAQRIWLSAIVHGDDAHLYFNMLSLLYKGVSLELAQGSLPFLALVAFSWAVSHALIFAAALGLHALGFDGSFYSCAVGFSAVLFALKYVLNARSDGWVSIQGIPLPVGWACWAELFLTSLISPNASFLGHLCGVLAGILWLDAAWLFGLGKRLYASAIARLAGRPRPRRYTYMRAPSGRRTPPPAPSAPPATAPGGAGSGNGNAHGHGLDATEERLLQEAIRRSLAEQGPQPPQQPQGDGQDVYRPSAPAYVPTATVVGPGAGPRLPTYEEATTRRRRG